MSLPWQQAVDAVLWVAGWGVCEVQMVKDDLEEIGS